MKRLMAVAAFSVCLHLLALPVAAAVYVDLVGDVAEPGIRVSDGNLVRMSYGNNFDEIDRHQVAVQPGENGVYRGAVRYQLWNASRVTLRVYSPAGTFAVMEDDLKFGTFNSSPIFDPKGVLPAYFHPGAQKIYVYHGIWQEMDTSQGFVNFAPAGPFDVGGLIGYGVNVYAAPSENAARTLLPLSRSAIEVKALEDISEMLCAEDFTAEIPSGTRFLWVEINDLGGNVLSRRGYRTSLAWVHISGDNLKMGPYVESSQPESQKQESSEEESSEEESSKASSKSASSARAASQPAASVSRQPSAASSKFEGVITSSQPAPPERASSSRTEPAETPAREAVVPQTTAAPEQPPPTVEPPLIYEIQRESKPDSAPRGVILYIFLMTAVIIYLLMRPKKMQ